MPKTVKQSQDSKVSSPRICLLSQRNIKKAISRCVSYEFEDIICEIDEVELLAPEINPKLAHASVSAKIAAKILKRIRKGHSKYGEVESFSLKRNYDIFLAFCQQPNDLSLLASCHGWGKCCQISICWLEEIWAAQLPNLQHTLDILSKFDYIILSSSGTVRPIADAINRPCYYLPSGVDAIRFSPYPNPPLRSIDVFTLGRRSETIHQSLLKMVKERQIFYFYYTIPKPIFGDYRVHRDMIANIAKRSKYFLVNPAKFNSQGQTKGQSEIAYRFFEGAASGAIMIGESPHNEAFSEHFH